MEGSGSAWHLQIHVIQQVSLLASAFVKIWDCGKRPALEFIRKIPLEETPGIPKPPNERISFTNYWLGVWGMSQGYVGKLRNPYVCQFKLGTSLHLLSVFVSSHWQHCVLPATSSQSPSRQTLALHGVSAPASSISVRPVYLFLTSLNHFIASTPAMPKKTQIVHRLRGLSWVLHDERLQS